MGPSACWLTHPRRAHFSHKPQTLFKVETFDGKSFMAFPHHTDGNALDNWWGSVARGWEKDSLKTIRTLLQHRCV